MLSDALELLDRSTSALDTRRLIAKALDDKLAAKQRDEFAAPGGFYKFVKHFWPVIEPDIPLIEGWAMEAVCLHLEACADGRIRRLLVNISPGTAKSTLCSVMFPLWIWSAKNRPGERFLSMSYSSNLPERDNRKKLLIIRSTAFQRLYGGCFKLTKEGEQLIQNNKTGYCMALGVSSSVTGNRGSFLVYDDPNNIAEDSDAIRESTALTFREAVSSRLNEMSTSVIIVIQQRSHEADISGVILDEGMPYEHLMIPCEYDGRHCTTSIGWTDPRTTEGECFWPERFTPEVIRDLKITLGDHAWAGQFQQSPEARGGGILKRDYWQLWDEPEYPECDFILASLDPAFTSREENDPSGFTIWGTFLTKEGTRAVILLYAFRKRLELCGPELLGVKGESIADYRKRTKDKWGLIEHVHDACHRFRVNHLIVEAKGPGISVVQAMNRIFLNRARYTIGMVEPKKLDKQARMIRVQPEFSAKMVYAPDRTWANMVIDEAAVAPRGRYDDLTDSLTQAIFWLRSNGFLERREEQFVKKQEAMKQYKAPAPLYPI